MGKGQGWGSAILVRTESTYGTDPGSGSLSLPFTSESVQANRPSADSGAIVQSREIQHQNPQIIDCGGDLTVELDGHHFAKMAYYWNGQVTSAEFAPVSGFSAGSPSSGGSVPDGAYYYKVAVVLQRTGDSKYFFASISAASSQVTFGSGNNTVQLSWTLPTAPDGFTIYGVAVFRTAASGAASTVTYLDTEVGAAVTTFDDDGSATLGTTLPPGSLYTHTFVAAAPVGGTHPLKSFTYQKHVDHAAGSTASEIYTGMYVDTIGISVSDPNSPVEATYGMMGQTVTLSTNPTPSYTSIMPMMSWQSFLLIDDTAVSLFESGELTLANNLEAVPQLSGNQYHRDFYPGMRNITGSLDFGFENHTQYTKAINATDFDAKLWCDGTSTIAAGTSAVTDSVSMEAMRYAVEFHMPKCRYQQAGTGIGGPDRMVESLPFNTSYDSTEGYAFQMRVFNTTSSIS